MQISVASNIEKIVNTFDRMGQNVNDIALPRALNKMMAQVKTKASREIRAVGYGIKARDIKAAMSILRATPTQLTVRLKTKGKPIPLMSYGATKTPHGVSVKVLNGRKIVQHAFIATMQSGHKGVFRRDRDARHKKNAEGNWGPALPIHELFGPAIPDALKNEKVNAALRAIVGSKFDAILRHEVAYVLR